jgi:hypothetical protein
MVKFYRQESVAYFSPSEKFVNETNSQVGKSAFISLKRKKLTAGNSRGGIFGLILEEGNCGKAEDESGYLERFQFEANRRRRDRLVRQSFRKPAIAGSRTDEVGLDSVNCPSRALEVRQTCLLRTTSGRQ